MVAAEACNAVYRPREIAGNQTGIYNPEVSFSNLSQLFELSKGDYLISSSVRGQKSFSPSGGAGYFTQAFAKALGINSENFSVEGFLNNVSKITTELANDIAGKSQNPQWLSGDYYNGKAKTYVQESSVSTSKPYITIDNVEVTHDIYKENVHGMNIAYKVHTIGMPNQDIYSTIYLYKGDNTTKLISENGEHSKSPTNCLRTLDDNECDFKGTWFKPYYSLPVEAGFDGKLTFDIEIKDSNGNIIALNANNSFYFSQQILIKYYNHIVNSNLINKVSFIWDNRIGKSGLVACYFYDINGNPLKAKTNKYATTNGNLSCNVKLDPRYEITSYEDLAIPIPLSELNNLKKFKVYPLAELKHS